jgi:hypothetical protein
MLELESDHIITLSTNELEISYLESFFKVIQDADLLDEAIIAEKAIKSTGLSKLIACKGTEASFSLPLSALEKIGAIDTRTDNEFKQTHPFVTNFGLQWNNPKRFRGQCERLSLENAENLSIPACLRIRAAVQYASNAVINSEKVRWLNAYINSLDIEDPNDFQSWQTANALNASIMQSEEILRKLALDFDDLGFATERMKESVIDKIAELKEHSTSELATCQINKSDILPPDEPDFTESLHYRYCFLNHFLLSYAEEIHPMVSESDKMKENRRATLLLELIQQAILVMAQEGKWQTSYQLRYTQIDAETNSFNVPYSIFQQTEYFHQYRMGEREAIDVLAEIFKISKNYEFNWLRWLQSLVISQCPVVVRWHQLLKIQDIDDLIGCKDIFDGFITDVKRFSEELCVENPESSWILVAEEKGESQYATHNTLNVENDVLEEKNDNYPVPTP